MKWFKHDTNANMDAKLRRVRAKYGMEGYGLFWYLLELIGSDVGQTNLSFDLEHDAELISLDTNIHMDMVQEMMTFMVNLGLFENNQGIIRCIKMLARTDEYTQKLLRLNHQQSGQTPDSVGTTSGQCRDNIPPIRIEEIRKDNTNGQNGEQLWDVFWKKYPRKVKKDKAKKLFLKLTETVQHQIATDNLALRYQGVGTRYIPHATTYLNDQAYLDPIEQTNGTINQASSGGISTGLAT